MKAELVVSKHTSPPLKLGERGEEKGDRELSPHFSAYIMHDVRFCE